MRTVRDDLALKRIIYSLSLASRTDQGLHDDALNKLEMSLQASNAVAVGFLDYGSSNVSLKIIIMMRPQLDQSEARLDKKRSKGLKMP